MEEGKIIELDTIYNSELGLDVKFELDKNEKSIYILIENRDDIENYLIGYQYLYKNKIYIKQGAEKYMTLIVNSKIDTYFNGIKYYKIKCDNIYVGNVPIQYEIENISEFKITIGQYNDTLTEKFYRDVFGYVKEFKYKEYDIKIVKQEVQVKINNGYVKEFQVKEIINNFREIIWIMYGFFVELKKIEYNVNQIKFIEYPVKMKIYLSKKRFLRKAEKLVDINCVEDWYEILDKYKKLKQDYGETVFSGIFLSQCESNTFEEICMVNLVQSIDAITSSMYIDDTSENKKLIIKKIKIGLRQCRKEFEDDEEMLKDINDVSSSIGKMAKMESLKVRLRKLVNEDISNEVFNIEINRLDEELEQCYVFRNIEEILKIVCDERVRLSHMCGYKWDIEKILYSNLHHKLLLIVRIELIKLLGIKDYIVKEYLNKNVKLINLQLIENNYKCRECQIYYNNKKIKDIDSIQNINDICKFML